MLRAMVCLCATGCVYLEGLLPVDADGTAAAPPPSALDLRGAGTMWLLVHPTDAPAAGPGIVQIDATGVEVSRLPLPPGAASPHGLAWDGERLWMSDLVTEATYAIDPGTGDVVSELPGRATEGIAVDGDGLWVAGGGVLRIDATTGEVTEQRPGPGTIQDIAFDGVDVITLTNGSPDFATRIAPDGTRTQLPEAVTEGNIGYAMTYWEGELLLIDDLYGENVLRHVDPFTGGWIETDVLPVEGWITAIALE